MKLKNKPDRSGERVNPNMRTERLLDRLLDAASAFFMEKGYEATSMVEIARSAHASKETFYRHFPTKDELFRAVVLRRANLMAAEFSEVLISNETPARALTAVGELILSRLVTIEGSALHRVVAMERERFPDLSEAYFAAGPKRIRASLAEYMEKEAAKGDLRKLEGQVAARQFFDLVAADVLLGSAISARAAPSKAEMKKLVKEAVDCFLHGYHSSS